MYAYGIKWLSVSTVNFSFIAREQIYPNIRAAVPLYEKQ